MYNPSLTQEPRYEPAKILPLSRDRSHLDWLAAEGHLIARPNEDKESTFSEDVEISDLLDLDVDEHIFDKVEEHDEHEFDTLDED
jgi:hypothetical protein